MLTQKILIGSIVNRAADAFSIFADTFNSVTGRDGKSKHSDNSG